MEAKYSTPVHRIVVVHGEPDIELQRVLRDSGLEAVDNGDVTIWAPPSGDTPVVSPEITANDPVRVDHLREQAQGASGYGSRGRRLGWVDR